MLSAALILSMGQALATPNTPPDIDWLNEAVRVGEFAYASRSPVHVAAGVSHVEELDNGRVLYIATKPGDRLDQPTKTAELGVWDLAKETRTTVIRLTDGSNLKWVSSSRSHALFESQGLTPDLSALRARRMHLIDLRTLNGRQASLPIEAENATLSLVQEAWAVFSEYPGKQVLVLSANGALTPMGPPEPGWSISTDQDSIFATREGVRGAMRYFDLKTRQWSETPPPDTQVARDRGFSEPAPEPPSDLPETKPLVEFLMRPTTSSVSGTSRSRIELWMAVDAPDFNRAMLSADANKLRRFGDRYVVYVERGHLFVREIVKVERQTFMALGSAAESRELLSKAKQVGTGMALYASDFDDNFPGRNGWQDKLLPYVKNRSLLEGFEYTLDSKYRNINEVEKPAETELGRVRGRFGTAVVMADTSARWKPNP